MTPSDRTDLLQQLQDSRTALMTALAGVSEEQASRMPAEGWSILGCVEHVAMAERGMLAMIARGSEPADEVVDRSEQEEKVRQLGLNRERKLSAPELAHPSGRYATLKLAADRFNEARDRTIAYIDKCEDDLRGRFVNHAIGRITARECLLLIIQHPRRHAEQIRELTAAG